MILAGLAVVAVGFAVWYFFYHHKAKKAGVSPWQALVADIRSTITKAELGAAYIGYEARKGIEKGIGTIEKDASNFVAAVNKGFSNVITGTEKEIAKGVGLGERELGNTVGFIGSSISKTGSAIESDASNFVKGVESVFNNIGKSVSAGIAGVGQFFTHKIEAPIEAVKIGGFEKGIGQEAGQIAKAVEQAPKEISHEAQIIGSDIEKGAQSFVSGVYNLFKHL